MIYKDEEVKQVYDQTEDSYITQIKKSSWICQKTRMQLCERKVKTVLPGNMDQEKRTTENKNLQTSARIMVQQIHYLNSRVREGVHGGDQEIREDQIDYIQQEVNLENK